MKKLYVYLFLVFFALQTPSFSDDIRDFQIEGMSIGDSLLKYIDEAEIVKRMKTDYPNSKKFGRIFKKFPNSIYDTIQFHIKVNDPKYIIYSISGVIYFNNNMKACIDKRKEVVNEMTKVISGKIIDVDSEKHIDKEGDIRSTTYPQYIKVNGGFVDFVCTDWTKKYEDKEGTGDSLKVILTTKELDDWINTEAF